MNAINFIQQHGVEKAREVVEGVPKWAKWWCVDKQKYLDFIPCSNCVDLFDLKRLVESVDLVGKVHGITTAKAHVKQAHEQGYSTISIPVEINGSIGMGCLYIDTLEKAIADYEAIYSGAES